MAKLTQHDRELRDTRIVKGRVQNLLKLTNSLRQNNDFGMMLTKEDDAELVKAKQAFEAILSRMKNV